MRTMGHMGLLVVDENPEILCGVKANSNCKRAPSNQLSAFSQKGVCRAETSQRVLSILHSDFAITKHPAVDV
jgi:hypothetical protein